MRIILLAFAFCSVVLTSSCIVRGLCREKIKQNAFWWLPPPKSVF
jgi:hypothetical protein